MMAYRQTNTMACDAMIIEILHPIDVTLGKVFNDGSVTTVLEAHFYFYTHHHETTAMDGIWKDIVSAIA